MGDSIMTHYRIESKYFVVAVGINEEGIITMTANYVKWLKGKTLSWLELYARRKNWKLQKIGE